MTKKGWHGFFIGVLALLICASIIARQLDWAQAFALLLFFYGILMLVTESLKEDKKWL